MNLYTEIIMIFNVDIIFNLIYYAYLNDIELGKSFQYGYQNDLFNLKRF